MNDLSNDTPEHASRIAYLIAAYIQGKLTEAEHDELDNWVNFSDRNMKLFEELTDENNIAANMGWMQNVDTISSFEKLKQLGHFEAKPKRGSFVWIAAAASLVLLVGLFFLFRGRFDKTSSAPVVITDTSIKPGTDKAILTMSTNERVELSTEQLTLQDSNGNFKVTSNGKMLDYTLASTKENLQHMLITPAGGQYCVRLNDGTMVWLNAQSTLQYPVAFNSGNRTVQLTGEAYFEVTPDASRPFRVMMKDSSTVTVLGTHFNINSYPDEMIKTVSLIEGSVLVESNNAHLKLTPGKQAKLEGKALTSSNIADMSAITGWKDGNFVFRNATIAEIMQQVSRWYNVQVEYSGENKFHFNATIERSEPLERLLTLLEKTEQVHFKIEKNSIHVLP